MFRGINNVSLDGKGRLGLPARMREALVAVSEGKVVLTIDMREPCLLLYPLPEWEIVQRKLASLSNINPQARLLQRLLIGHATDLDLDGNGRIVVPAMLREYASLDKKVVVLGQGNKVELWADDAWRERMQNWLGEEADDLLSDGDAFTGLSV